METSHLEGPQPVNEAVPMTRIMTTGIMRGISLFLGGFSALNLLGECRTRWFDANLWWIDLHFLPTLLARLVLLLASLAFLCYGAGIGRARLRLPIRIVTAMMGLFTIANTIAYYDLLLHHRIYAGPLLPASFALTITLVCVFLALGQPPVRLRRQHGGVASILLALIACLVAFPLLQIYTFGVTDYRRPADAIVVLGALAYADGTPSDALADRVRTAVDLYQQGYAPLLIFSGGPGAGKFSEPQCMRLMALRLGVPDKAMVLDEQGLNTQMTVNNTCRLFPSLHVHRFIAVSHFFHVPRIKMAYLRAGWNVYTVPAVKPQLHSGVRFLVCREVAGLWVYYLRPLWEK
jgi:vancomycin permeability regulator SanA